MKKHVNSFDYTVSFELMCAMCKKERFDIVIFLNIIQLVNLEYI